MQQRYVTERDTEELNKRQSGTSLRLLLPIGLLFRTERQATVDAQKRYPQ